MPVHDDDDKNTEQSLAQKEENISDAHSSATSELDDNELGFYRPDKDSKEGLSGRFQKIRGSKLLKNKKAVGGFSAAILVIVIAGSFFFNFMNWFQLDHIFNNIDVRTFSRFNASFSGRSDTFLRSYIKMRMLEIDGTNKPDSDGNLYFRANKVDTDNPTRDWYRTLRTSRFEDDLFRTSGVRFTSVVDKSGNIRPGMITVSGKNYDIDVNKSGANIDKLLSEIDDKTVKIFDSHVDARRAVKKAVDDNTRFWRVIKRRHLRRDIYNMTGIKEWRFFEKTRDKLDNTKINMQRKIVRKVFAGNSKMSLLLRCIMGVDVCPVSDDTSNPDNKVETADGSSGKPLTDGTEETEAGDPDNPNDNIKSTGDEVVDTLEKVESEVVDEPIEESIEKVGASSVDEVGEMGLSKLFTKSLVKELAGFAGTVVKIWSFLKKIVAIDKLFGSEASDDSKIVKIVKMARLAQLMGVYATYAISKDQIHSGELVGDELTNFYGTMKDFGNSEGWAYMNGTNIPKNSINKDEYCKDGHDKKFGEFAWYCDSQKPDAGGNAEKLTNAYDSTIGYVLSPIADAVNAIKSIPIIGGLIDWVAGLFEKIVSAIIEPIINAILEAFGLDKTIEDLVSWIMTKLMDFLGVGPMFDGSEPGVANLLIAGSAGTAESGTRASGGSIQTKESAEYSNKLAQDYRQDQLEQQSLYSRYLSIDNHSSIFSKILFNVSNTSPSRALALAGSFLIRLPHNLINAIFKPLSAEDSAQDLNDWAGVDKYDIPQQCIKLDPLDPNYLTKGVFLNGLELDVPLTYELARDTTTFWEAVNKAAMKINPDHPDLEAKPVWNCHLLDARVQGGIGYLYGYDKDNGFELGETSEEEPISDGECAPGSENLGQDDGYDDGKKISITLCAIEGTNSAGQESTPGDKYYVEGAKGRVLVRSEASQDWVDLFKKAGSVDMSVTSSYRTMKHQIDLWNDNCTKNGKPSPYNGNPIPSNPNNATCSPTTAWPGWSNHQQGTAIDFTAPKAWDEHHTICPAMTTDPSATYKWLDKYAGDFDVVQYCGESWHWQWEGR